MDENFTIEEIKEIKYIENNPSLDVNEKLMAVTKKMLDDGRRIFGIAGASLQNQLDDPKYEEYEINPKLVQAGISGEKQTSNILRKWVDKHPGAVLIDSISLPIEKSFEVEKDEDGNIDLGDTDHVVIVGKSIAIIDSKNWKAKASYSINEDGFILRSKKMFQGNKPKITQAKFLWMRYFQNYNMNEWETFVCISADENTFIERSLMWWKVGYKLVNQDTLVKFLDKWYDERVPKDDKYTIHISVVANTLRGLVKPYNKFKEKFGNSIYNKTIIKRQK